MGDHVLNGEQLYKGPLGAFETNFGATEPISNAVAVVAVFPSTTRVRGGSIAQIAPDFDQFREFSVPVFILDRGTRYVVDGEFGPYPVGN